MAVALVFAGQDATLWVLSPEKNVEGGGIRFRGTRRHALGLAAGKKCLMLKKCRCPRFRVGVEEICNMAVYTYLTVNMSVCRGPKWLFQQTACLSALVYLKRVVKI